MKIGIIVAMDKELNQLQGQRKGGEMRYRQGQRRPWCPTYDL